MKHLQAKQMMVIIGLGIMALLVGCTTTPSSEQELTPFKTLTLERSRVRAGRAAIMALVRPSAEGEPPSANVQITRIGGRAVGSDFHSVILDAVPHSIGVSVDAGPERFISLPLVIDKRYLIIAHRYTDNIAKPTTESLDLWVQEADSGRVVYGERSAVSDKAILQPQFSNAIERHRMHLLSLFVDAS